MSDQDPSFVVETTAQIVSAYLANNATPTTSIAGLIADISASLNKLMLPESGPAQEPAVNPKKSIQPDYLISLEDGSRYKSLKRHLMTKYQLTPAEYRAKWDLPRDYPMVAPNYAAARSELAKKSGLGRKAIPIVTTKTKPQRKSVATVKLLLLG